RAAFYAQGDTRTPVRATFIAVGVNLALNLLFVGPLAGLGLAHRGLALATSVTSLLNLGQLAFRLRSRIGGIDGRRMLRSLLRLLVASAFTGALLAIGLAALGDVSGRGVAFRALVVAGGAAGALVVGGVAMRLLRVEELGLLGGLVRSTRARWRGGDRGGRVNATARPSPAPPRNDCAARPAEGTPARRGSNSAANLGFGRRRPARVERGARTAADDTTCPLSLFQDHQSPGVHAVGRAHLIEVEAAGQAPAVVRASVERDGLRSGRGRRVTVERADHAAGEIEDRDARLPRPCRGEHDARPAR